ncbi:DNA-binding protein [Brucella pituitosa]|uniref:DNA-binding protein n=1 Tax=Brucella pituitosa TaxID=571256 RepID=A0A643EXG6_9HYPH|nr:DNA-binding protein [Brucella pituitosa]KAB0570593.1 DNA-binding protein [Brucella pituitosa]
MEQDKEGADLLYGAVPIANFLGITEKQARHRIETGHIPTFRIGGTICSRRTSLRAWLADMEAKARTAGSAGN